MRRFIILILIAFTTTVSAQDSQRVIWNWAWKESSSELLAYSQNGDLSLLSSDFILQPSHMWRISDSEAIGLFNISNQQSLFLLSSRDVEEISIGFDREQFDQFLERGSGLRSIVYNQPYLFFTTWNPVNQIATTPLIFIELPQ